MNCKKCNSEHIVKCGLQKNGRQKFKCKSCGKYQQLEYSYNSHSVSDSQIIQLTKEGCGIRSTSRILKITPNTVIRRILRIAKCLNRKQPLISGGIYQVDELFTFIGNKNKRVCVAYSFEPNTGKVIDVVVGSRNKTNLRIVIDTLLLSNPKKITTDKLNIYKEIIPKTIHSTKFRGINGIERMNLNLRTHLKRLSRRSICFSKSLMILLSCVRLYFWG
jgi:insertion element IS1 protein InsB